LDVDLQQSRGLSDRKEFGVGGGVFHENPTKATIPSIADTLSPIIDILVIREQATYRRTVAAGHPAPPSGL
jgi:hypothetical protein